MPKIASLLAALCALSAAGAALADPPTLVGRLSLVEGSASIRHSYDQQWVPGGVNFPVIAGDGVWSDQDSRVEIEIEGTEARLDEASELDIERLDESGAVLHVAQGVANLTVRYLPPGGMQVMTSVGQLSIRQPGEYHIDAGRPGGPATQLLLAALSGEATFSGLRGVVELHSGQGAMVPPDQSTLEGVSVYPTPFDQWAESRAGQLAVAQTVTYVSPEMTGYQDLGAFGTWQTTPDYGTVWFPSSVEIGWAPYRYGHWDYIRPWGWTWIDNAPWGFAPFHYGRWAEFDGRWGWIPGERHEHPCYAPALVAFVGGEPGEAHVGWVPLGPHEVFRPYYAHSDIYVININRGHVHDDRDIERWNHSPPDADRFANRRAATEVSAATFSGGQPVRQNMTPVNVGVGNRPVLTDPGHLPPPPAQRPQAQPGAAPQPGPRFERPEPQSHSQPAQPGMPQQFQPHPQPAQQAEQFQRPQPAQQAQQFQPHPQPAPQPQQFQPHPQPVEQPHPMPMAPQPQPQYQPPHPVQPAPQPQQPQQQHPQQQQQPRREPQDREHQAQH